ncbi:MAG: hypothetical protein HY078_13940 [Elusimicrobia bacterium]|nr:hypothetical protein [Elusimicrobiota bacterium]
MNKGGLVARFSALGFVLLSAVAAVAGPVVQAPASAPTALTPLVGMVLANPGIRLELNQTILSIGSLAQPSLSSLVPAAGVSVESLSLASNQLQATQVARILYAHPRLVIKGKEQLSEILTPEAIESLETSVRAMSKTASKDPESQLAKDLKHIQAITDLPSMSSVADVDGAIRRLVENQVPLGGNPSGGAAAAPVIVDKDSGGRAPVVALTKPAGDTRRPVSVVPAPNEVPPGQAPRMSEAQLAEYVRAHTMKEDRIAKTEQGGLVRVNFESGVYRPEYAPILKKMGVDLVAIIAPTKAEIETYDEDRQGFFLKTEYTRYVTPARTIDEFIDLLPGRESRRTWKNEIQKSEVLASNPELMKVVPLTVELFETWYQIYEEEVVRKGGGKRNIPRSHARDLLAKGELSNWHGLFYMNPDNPSEMLGGVIFLENKPRKMLVAGYAAYRKRLKNGYFITERTVIEGNRLALKLGYKVLSLGQDTNFYGYDYPLGLRYSKAKFRVSAYPEDRLILLNVINPAKMYAITHNKKRGGYLFDTIRRDSPLLARYYAALENDPKSVPEAQDLLGSDYFTPNILPSPDVLVVNHFSWDDIDILQPVGLGNVRKHSLPPPEDSGGGR